MLIILRQKKRKRKKRKEKEKKKENTSRPFPVLVCKIDNGLKHILDLNGQCQA